MAEVSISPAERSRNAYTRFLQRMQGAGVGVATAATLGTSESTVSRIKTEKVEDALALLYAVGFKLVSNDRVCVDRDELRMLRQSYVRMVQNEQISSQFFGDDE
jgi:hypothetical protein